MEPELASIARDYSTCRRCKDLSLPTDPNRFEYASLARKFLPAKVKVLFVAESAPARNKRGLHSFFYLPEDDPRSQHPSALFWEIARVLELPAACGTDYVTARSNPRKWKPALLAEFASRHLWLIDSAKCAVNGLAEGKIRNTVLIRCTAAWLKRELDTVHPERLVLIKTNVFRVLLPILGVWGYADRVLHRSPIPHPGSGQQVKFRSLLGSVVREHPILFRAAGKLVRGAHGTHPNLGS